MNCLIGALRGAQRHRGTEKDRKQKRRRKENRLLIPLCSSVSLCLCAKHFLRTFVSLREIFPEILIKEGGEY